MQMEMPVDIPVLMLACGRSLLPADVALPLHPTAAPRALSAAEAAGPEVDAVRLFLATARTMEHSMAPEVLDAVEADLVASRQADAAITQSDLHRWITLARLLSHSHGEAELTFARWREVRSMEACRAERLRVR